MSRASRVLSRVFPGIFAAVMAAVLVVLLCCSSLDYAAKRLLSLPGWQLLLLGLAAAALLYVLAGLLCRLKIRGREVLSLPRAEWVLFAVVFLLQLVLAYSYYFRTNWDVGAVTQTAENLAHAVPGEKIKYIYNYGRYPNNLLITFLFSRLMRAAHLLGLHAYEYFVLIAVQCFVSSLTLVLLLKTARLFPLGKQASVTAGLLYLLLVSLSPWVTVPYSDSLGLFFPVTLLYLALRRTEKPLWAFLRFFLLAALSVAAYFIKPTLLAVPAGLLFYRACAFLFARRGKKAAASPAAPVSEPETDPRVRAAAGLFAGLVCSLLLCSRMAFVTYPDRPAQKTFGWAHFLMMGFNEDYMGTFAQEDVLYSDSFATPEERSAGNLEAFRNRVAYMKASGVADLMLRKTLTNYNDGTFCWGGEGNFYLDVPERSGWLNSLTRSVYYNGEEETGSAYPAWQHSVQALWLALLLLALLSAFRRPCRPVLVCMAAVLFLTVFHLLFEARARYFFAFVPLYILLAVSGLEAVRSFFIRLFRLRKATA